MGKTRDLLEEDIDEFLKDVPLDPSRGYRERGDQSTSRSSAGPFPVLHHQGG